MARTVTAASKAAAQSEVCTPVQLVELDFSGGFLRLTTSPHNIVFDGDTYSGIGKCGSLSQVEEASEQKAYSINVTLSGVASDLISVALGQEYQGRSGKVWLGFINSSGALIADPMVSFSGRMDTMDLSLGATGKLSVIIQSRLADWERPRLSRYTNEEQQALYSGDKGFEFVSQMVEKTIIWGR